MSLPVPATCRCQYLEGRDYNGNFSSSSSPPSYFLVLLQPQPAAAAAAGFPRVWACFFLARQVAMEFRTSLAEATRRCSSASLSNGELGNSTSPNRCGYSLKAPHSEAKNAARASAPSSQLRKARWPQRATHSAEARASFTHWDLRLLWDGSYNGPEEIFLSAHIGVY